MDNFLRRFRKKKPPPPPRREPLRNADQLIRSDEAKEKIINAVGKYGPGVPLRWDKMLQIINTNVDPTEENYDPLRVETDKEELKLVLRHLYDNKKSIASDGLALAREFIPLLYDKHTVDRALNVSQRESDQRGITAECYAYGELDHEIFAAMYLRLVFVYGEKQNGIFYDLGCGVGTLVCWHTGNLSVDGKEAHCFFNPCPLPSCPVSPFRCILPHSSGSSNASSGSRTSRPC